MLIACVVAWGLGASAQPAAVSGDWRWMDGALTAFRDDGTFLMPNDAVGTWRALGGGVFVVRWPTGRIDRLRLSRDGRTLSGQGNLNGARVWVRASRMGEDGLATLLARVDAARGDRARLAVVLAAPPESRLTGRQLVALLGRFRSEAAMLKVAEALAPYVDDPAEALGFARTLRSPANRARLTRILSPAPEAPRVVSPPPAPPRDLSPPPAPPRTVSPPPAPVGDIYACQTAADCVIFCPSVPGCCHSACGCTHAMRRDQTAAYEARYAQTCRRPPHCPAEGCARREAAFADCRDGRCVPSMTF